MLNPIRAIDCNAPLDTPFASITPVICALLSWLARWSVCLNRADTHWFDDDVARYPVWHTGIYQQVK